jgi:hypothetical protein
MSIKYITSINDTDKDKVLLLIKASLQAYNVFDKDNPTLCQLSKIKPLSDAYKCVECWTGIDSIFNDDKTEEIYGIVFRTIAAPYTYIFAFRGTASIMDIIDDLGVDHSHFTAFDESVKVPSGVKVESGFFDVYTQSEKFSSSMQDQLFALIDKYQSSDKKIAELFITGHSLGSSICELFTLDVALSRPDIVASNINFACPRVGNQDFVDFYDAQKPQQNIKTQTLRVQNTYDKVPCVPLEKMGYEHTNYAYLITFYKDTWDGKVLFADSHSAYNYQAVLECAAKQTSGVCVDGSLNVPKNGYAVKSGKPDTNTVCDLF